jgi:hypothetical protein
MFRAGRTKNFDPAKIERNWWPLLEVRAKLPSIPLLSSPTARSPSHNDDDDDEEDPGMTLAAAEGRL